LLAPDEQTAVARGLRDGRPAAWTALYDGFAADVWRYVARLLGSDQGSVADVVQETFLGAARSAGGFDPQRGTLAGWLFGIAHRQVGLHWRKRHRDDRGRRAATAAADEARRAAERNHAATEASGRRELDDLIRSVLAELSAEYARLLLAKYLDERSLAELAAEQGDTVDAVKSKLARARREFRSKYERANQAAERDAIAERDGLLAAEARQNSKSQAPNPK
jgi:RNA polymerase sigma-70 factor (ECF subfamily)